MRRALVIPAAIAHIAMAMVPKNAHQLPVASFVAARCVEILLRAAWETMVSMVRTWVGSVALTLVLTAVAAGSTGRTSELV